MVTSAPISRHLCVVGKHAGVPGVVGADDCQPGSFCLLDRNGSGTVRDEVANVVATVDARRDGRLMEHSDWTAAITSALDSLGDTDRPAKPP